MVGTRRRRRRREDSALLISIFVVYIVAHAAGSSASVVYFLRPNHPRTICPNPLASGRLKYTASYPSATHDHCFPNVCMRVVRSPVAGTTHAPPACVHARIEPYRLKYRRPSRRRFRHLLRVLPRPVSYRAVTHAIVRAERRSRRLVRLRRHGAFDDAHRAFLLSSHIHEHHRPRPYLPRASIHHLTRGDVFHRECIAKRVRERRHLGRFRRRARLVRWSRAHPRASFSLPFTRGASARGRGTREDERRDRLARARRATMDARSSRASRCDE